MTLAEKNRLYEVLFYLYFSRQPQETLSDQKYWDLIKSIANYYGANINLISQAIRLLTHPDNTPTEEEIVYLLNKAGVSVRPIHRVSGIYWQKQKKFLQHFKDTSPPVIFSRLTDVTLKINVVKFIQSMYNIGSIFNTVDQDLLFKEDL